MRPTKNAHVISFGTALAILLAALFMWWMLGCKAKKPIAGTISGTYDLLIGDDAGHDITTGNYDICFGSDSCSKVTTQDCVVDIKPLPKQYGLEPALARIALNITIPGIIGHCGLNMERLWVIQWLQALATGESLS